MGPSRWMRLDSFSSSVSHSNSSRSSGRFSSTDGSSNFASCNCCSTPSRFTEAPSFFRRFCIKDSRSLFNWLWISFRLLSRSRIVCSFSSTFNFATPSSFSTSSRCCSSVSRSDRIFSNGSSDSSIWLVRDSIRSLERWTWLAIRSMLSRVDCNCARIDWFFSASSCDKSLSLLAFPL